MKHESPFMFRIYDKVYTVNFIDVSLSIFIVSRQMHIQTEFFIFYFDIYCQYNEYFPK